jgi:hypothetical protein
MAAVLGLTSCTSADNIAQITPSATLGAATSAPTSNGAEPAASATLGAASSTPTSSSAESAASSAPSATEPAESSAPSSTEPAASTAPSSTASDIPTELCPQAPAPLNAGEESLEFTTELRLGGVPMVYGEPNALEGGGTLLPLNFRFYISEVALVRDDATEVRVDIVDDGGSPVHYGVQFVIAEEPSSMRFRVLGPPGTYSGVSFLLGVSDACDSGFPGEEPFAFSSGMTWDHGLGYLFLRYEGTVTNANTEEAAPPAIHMGGLQGILLAPRVQAPGEFTVVENAPAGVHLIFDVDELFAGATSSLDLSDISPLLPPLPEVALGERARRLAPELPLFTLEPQ